MRQAMNMIEVTKNLATDEQCFDYLERKRWPDGKIRCLRCGADRISRVERKSPGKNKRNRLYSCLEPTCNYQFSPTTGTIFHDSHMPLTKYLTAAPPIVPSKQSINP